MIRSAKASQTCFIFTVRNEVEKVVFLHVCVCPQGGLPQCMLGYQPPRSKLPPGAGIPQQQTPPPGADTPWSRPPGSRHTPLPGSRHTPLEQTPSPPQSRPRGADNYCCRWYASYWNAFLFGNYFSTVTVVVFTTYWKSQCSTSLILLNTCFGVNGCQQLAYTHTFSFIH